MSVRDKIEEMTEAKKEFSETEREFEAYAAEFDDDIEAKRDVSYLVEGTEALREEMKGANESFDAYSEAFGIEIDRLNAEADERRDAIYDVVKLFDDYADVFATDVAKKQDVSDLLNAVEAFQAELAATEDAFDAHGSEFAIAVAAIQDVSDLLAAIQTLRPEFAAVENEFDEYAETFEGDVGSFHESVAEQRKAFETASDAFAEYRDEFREVEVQALLDAVVAFRAEIDNVRAEFETTEDAFAAFGREFYRQSDTGEQLPPEEAEVDPEREDKAEANLEEPDAETEKNKSPAEAPESESSPESVTIEVGSESPETAEADDEQPEAADDEPEATETAEANGDTTVEAETADDMVECLICGEYYQAITEPHLQTHDMTIQEYRDEYGEDVQLRPDNT